MTDPRISFRWRDELYALSPDVDLVCEIESELGGVPALAEKFRKEDWTVQDSVTLLQMLIQAAGRTVDYRVLGNAVLQGEISDVRGVLTRFLNVILKGLHA